MPERSSRNAPREWERNNSSNSIRLILLNESGGHDWKLRRALLTYLTFRGRLAQLGERIVRNDEAGGSIPPPSTKSFYNLDCFSKLQQLLKLPMSNNRVLLCTL